MTVVLGVIAAGLTAGALFDTGRRRALWSAAALFVAAVLLAADQWDAPQLEAFRQHAGVVVLALVVGVAATGGLAWLFLRHRLAFPAAVVVALPFRIPVGVGGEEANLLVPLYAVIAGGVVALVISSARSESPSRPRGLAAAFVPLLAGYLLFYAVALAWSVDPSRGIQDLAFFLVPFGVLFGLLLEVRWDERVLRTVFGVLLAQALVCATIGFGQYLAGSLFWNEAVIQSNQFHVYFRVNSLFWDPNLYGRYLALVITIAVTAMAWTRDRRSAVALGSVALVLWIALVTTFSQSSFLALVAGLLAVVALRWSLRAVFVSIAAAAVATVLFVTLAGGLVKLDLERLNPQTAGRANLVTGGIELFLDRPVAGFGSGSFSLAFRDEIAGPNAPVTESHAEPVTVAAETGVAGLVLYIGLIVTSLAVLLSGARAVMPGIGRFPADDAPGRAPPWETVARAAVLAGYVGLLVHTIFYAGYLDDPATWALLAIGYGLAFRCRDT